MVGMHAWLFLLFLHFSDLLHELFEIQILPRTARASDQFIILLLPIPENTDSEWLPVEPPICEHLFLPFPLIA